MSATVVSCGGDDDHAMSVGVVNGVLKSHGGTRAAQAHVDDLAAIVRRIIDGVDDDAGPYDGAARGVTVRRVALDPDALDLVDADLQVVADARNACRVVGCRRDFAGNAGTV